MLAQTKEWSRKNRKHLNRTSFEWRLKNDYGIDCHDWALLYEKQSGACAICKNKLTFDRETHVDHDHTSKIVRGLLCENCNKLLGHAKESIEILESAQKYLALFAALLHLIKEKYEDKSVPGEGPQVV